MTTLTVYTKNNCGFCTMAKGFLKNNNIEFAEVNIEQEAAAREFLIAEGHRTMPQIYLGDKLLVEGGWDGLRTLGLDGLKEKLNESQVDLTDLGSI